MSINAEKLYDLACENVKQMLLADGEKFEELERAFSVLTKDENIKGVMNMNPRLAPALEIYLAAKDELGKSKSGTAYTAMKRFVKSVPDARKDLKGTWNDAEGRQCACDGYRAVRLKKPVDGFESVHGMDLEKVFPQEYMLKEKLDVPTPGQVKIGRKKICTGRSCYDFGDGYPMVDASFLLDMLALLPDAEVWTTGAEHSMLYFRSDKGDGILLPVRKKDVA